MTPETTITLLAFVMVTSAFLMIFTLVNGTKAHLNSRLADLAAEGEGSSESATMASFARTTLPKMGTALVPTDEAERTKLKTRLMHAGIYGRQSMQIFLGVKMFLMTAPAIVGIVLDTLGILPPRLGLLGGACAGVFGMIGPSFWLDNKKSKRQSKFRRGLPDALDLIVICLEGGLSLPSALQRVSSELRVAHPELAGELGIVQREIQLGRTPGDALKQMAIRADLEELRSLSSVIIQAEKFGASMTKSLRMHAEALRVKRHQRAEEMGAKASTKILVPTLLFIFPAIFVVILAPAGIQIMRTLFSVNP